MLFCFAQPRVSEELSDWQKVFAIPRFRFFEVLFHISYYYWAKETRSLYRGLRYVEVRYIEVLLYTCPAHPHPIYIINSINIGAFVSLGGGGGAG